MADGIKIGLNQESVQTLKQQYEQLKVQLEEKNITVNINQGEIKAQIEALQGILNSLQNNIKPITINLDTVKAREELTAVKGTYQEIVNKFSEFGNIQIKSPKYDAEGNLQSFIAQLEQIPGLFQKIKFAESDNGKFIFDTNSIITETNNISKLTEEVNKFRDKYQSVLNEIKDSKLGSSDALSTEITKAQESLDSLNLNNLKEKASEVKTVFNDINNSLKNALDVDKFKESMNSQLNQLTNIGKFSQVEEIKSLKSELNNLVGTEPIERLQQLENKFNSLKNAEKNYSEVNKIIEQDVKNIESTYQALEKQIEKVNSIRNQYGKKLDTGSGQYIDLEINYEKLIKELKQYQDAGESLDKTQLNNINKEVEGFKNEANSIENITRIIKQEENAIDSLQNKFGKLFSNANEMKASLQNLYSSTNLKGDTNDFEEQIKNKQKELAELQRINGLGANIGSLSGSGLNMTSNIQDVNKWVKANIDARASVSSLSGVEETLNGKILTANMSIDRGSGIVEKYKIALDTSTDSIFKNSNGAQDLSSKHATLGESIANAASGFLKFQTIAMGTVAIVNGLKSGVEQINSLNEKMTNIAMVTGESMKTVQGYMNQYTQLSQQLHTTTSDIATSAEDFLRAGKTNKESMEMVKAAVVMAKEADMTEKESSEGLIAISNAYGILPDKIMNVVDMMTKLDNVSSSSVSEMNTALTKVASSANEVGVPLNKLLSYITEISSVTRTAPSTIGTGLNSIFSRFSSIRMGKKYDPNSGDALNNVEKSLQTVNIAIRKDKDTFKDFSDVLDEVGKKWSTYTDKQKNLISTQMAGKMLAPLYGNI